MKYKHIDTGRIISSSEYHDLDEWEQDDYESDRNDFTNSLIIGGLTGSGLLGGLLGGDLLGGIIGDELFND